MTNIETALEHPPSPSGEPAGGAGGRGGGGGRRRPEEAHGGPQRRSVYKLQSHCLDERIFSV